MRSLLRLVLLLFFTTSLGFAATPAGDLPLVTTGLAASFAEGASELTAEILLATLDADGHWPDLDVKYPPDTQGAVSRYVLFLRVWKNAAVWRAETDALRRKDVAATLHRALGYWLHKPKPDGIPWFYLIGAPQALARAALIFDSELTADERRAAIPFRSIQRGVLHRQQANAEAPAQAP